MFISNSLAIFFITKQFNQFFISYTCKLNTDLFHQKSVLHIMLNKKKAALMQGSYNKCLNILIHGVEKMTKMFLRKHIRKL